MLFDRKETPKASSFLIVLIFYFIFQNSSNDTEFLNVKTHVEETSIKYFSRNENESVW